MSITIDKLNLIVAVLTMLLYTLGIITIYLDDIKQGIDDLSNHIAKKRKERIISESKADKELRLLLLNTVNGVISPFTYKIITVGIFVFFFLSTIRALSFIMAVLLSAGFALLPYLLLKWRLSKGRNEASKEAENLMQSILQSYRINNGNMPKALQNVILENQRGLLKHTSPLLAKLILSYGSAQSSADIKEACDNFAYSIGTNWAVTLSNNFYRSLADGSPVLLSLEDLNAELMSARNLKEEQNRMNYESIILIALTPITYIVLMFFAKGVGCSPIQFIHQQFASVQCILLFCGVVLFTLLGILLEYIVRNKKFDI